jgi:hypothetical protein
MFDRVLEVVEGLGPVAVLPERTQILPDKVDSELAEWLAEAYLVGGQHHLGRP